MSPGRYTWFLFEMEDHGFRSLADFTLINEMGVLPVLQRITPVDLVQQFLLCGCF